MYNLYSKATGQFISGHGTPFDALRAIILIAGNITLAEAMGAYEVRSEPEHDYI